MSIGKVIYTNRKAINMTQEQLADKLGISVPAVSKWETNISMPDISLLAPIARIFNITIDELMEFNRELTDDEITKIVDETNKLVQESGFTAGMKYVEKIIQQYPNAEKLRLETGLRLLAISNATLLDGADYECFCL